VSNQVPLPGEELDYLCRSRFSEQFSGAEYMDAGSSRLYGPFYLARYSIVSHSISVGPEPYEAAVQSTG
jgi:hypothetical protein